MASEIKDAMETLDDARASIRIFYGNSSNLYSAAKKDKELEAKELKSLSMEAGTAWAASSQDYLDLTEAYNEGIYVEQALVDTFSDVLADIFDNSPAQPDPGSNPSAEEVFREVEQEVFNVLNQYHAAEYQTLLASREMNRKPNAADIARRQTNDEELEQAIEFNMNLLKENT